jgi:hypothetical protein
MDIMINVETITKDFFNKTPEEQRLAERILLFDCLKVIQLNKINMKDARENMERIINTAAENEDYEISELFNRVNNKLIKTRYGYGM